MKKQPFTEVNPANQCPLLTFLFKTKGLFAEIYSGKASFNLLGKPIFIDVLIPGPRRVPPPVAYPPPYIHPRMDEGEQFYAAFKS